MDGGPEWQAAHCESLKNIIIAGLLFLPVPERIATSKPQLLHTPSFLGRDSSIITGFTDVQANSLWALTLFLSFFIFLTLLSSFHLVLFATSFLIGYDHRVPSLSPEFARLSPFLS